MRSVPNIAALGLMSMAMACAQNATFLRGVLTDASGGVVPGADCVLTGERTGRVLTSVSWTDGSFRFADVPAGRYNLKVRARGFRVLVTPVWLRVSENVELHLSLEVGHVAEAVEVRPDDSLIDTAASTHSYVIDERRVVDLPVSGGNPVELAFLASGMLTSRNLLPMKAPFNGTAISADGSPPFTNEFQLDGISNTFADGRGQARDAFRPPPSAIREFKVQTTPYDASLGHAMGGTVSVVTAGGSPELHGEAHYWAKNSAFDAPNFFNNKNRTGVPRYGDHRYGASAGGPLWKRRHQTYWFYAWEANQWGMPQYYTATVPSAAERRGDFSELLALGAGYQIYDPWTAESRNGGHYQRQPLPGNVIPAGRLDAVGRSLANLYPLPTQEGRVGGLNNFFHASTAQEDYGVHVARLDRSFNDGHRAFARVHYDRWLEDKNHYYGDNGTGVVLTRVNRGLAWNDVRIFNPATVLSLRYGISNQEFGEWRSSRGYDLRTLGFSEQLTGLIDGRRATIPRFTAGAFSAYSFWESGDGGNSGVTHMGAATLTGIRGRHTWNAGGEARLYRAFGGRVPYSVSPDLVFSAGYTSGPMDNSPAAPLGQELAAMLLGIPGGSMSIDASSALQDRFLAAFVHDDFKLSRRLTLNLGVRYELELPFTERYNRLVAGFAPNQSNPIEAGVLERYAAQPIAGVPVETFRVRGGLTFLNSGGVGRSPLRGEKNNLMPRVGFAYRLTSRTTLRGGYGIFYDTIGVNAEMALQAGFSQSTPIQASPNGVIFTATTANPFPRGLIQPPGAAGGLRTNLGQALQFYDAALRHPYSQRWSFGFQHMFPHAWLLDCSYVGNRGVHLRSTRSLNEVPAAYLSASGVRDQANIDWLSASFASPFSGADAIYGSAISRASMVRPYPQFGAITVEESRGNSWYHSLQTRVERRFSNGYTLQFAYSWSKLMTATEYLNGSDAAPSRTIGDFDRTHRVAASGIWDAPDVLRRWKPLSVLARRWQLGGIVSMQSGPPLAFGNVLFHGDIGEIALPSNLRGADRWINVDAGFARAPNQQLAWNVRTFPLRLSGVRGDVLSRWDFSLIRNFRLQEKVGLQLRAEVFNAWNHPSFSIPNLIPTSAAFGTVTTTANESRQWQFSARIKF